MRSSLHTTHTAVTSIVIGRSLSYHFALRTKHNDDTQALGLDRLKAALMALDVKCGGTLQERAARLWSLRGVTDPAQIDRKLRAKK